MTILKTVREGEMLPRFYGVAWVEYASHCAVCLPVPLNLVASVARSVWIFLKHGGRRISMSPRAAYNEGHAHARAQVSGELERWRVNADEARRWLAEFPDVAVALDHLQRCADGVENPAFIRDVRDGMRKRRDSAKVIKLSPAEIQSGHDRVRWAEGLIRQLPAEHDGRNSWLLNYARSPEFTPAEKLIADDFGIAYPGDR